LILSTIIAGYIPARMIVKKNTLDSILGRNWFLFVNPHRYIWLKLKI
jgi:hypothetical protein